MSMTSLGTEIEPAVFSYDLVPEEATVYSLHPYLKNELARIFGATYYSAKLDFSPAVKEEQSRKLMLAIAYTHLLFEEAESVTEAHRQLLRQEFNDTEIELLTEFVLGQL